MKAKLNIPYGFFQDEVRDGFYVNGMMKRAWAAQLEVFVDIDELCSKYGINYFADWGTLLGAVRHGGFIPWDDDFDIGMTRHDYELFRKVSKEMGDNYHLHDVRDEPEYTEYISRVVNSHAISLDYEFLEKYHGFPFVVGVDIFVYDYLFQDSDKEEDRKSRAQLIADAIQLVDEGREYTREGKTLLSRIENMLGRDLTDEAHLKNLLYQCAIDVFSECKESESSEITSYVNYMRRQTKYSHPKNTFDNLIPMDYEMIQIPVPATYIEVLDHKYKNFKRIVKTGGEHCYPYYEGQMEILKEHRPDLWPKYNIENGIKPREYDETIAPQNVLFLPFKADYWETMKPAWEAACSIPGCEVKVVVLPYFEKAWDGTLTNPHYDGSLFPKDLQVISPDKYDLYSTKPDIIYFQNPWDDYNVTCSVHPLFYSNKLRGMTGRLICIPPLNPEPPAKADFKGMISLDDLVIMPGIMNSDVVYVTNSDIRKMYIEKIADSFIGCFGENLAETYDDSELVALINNKIQVAPWKSEVKENVFDIHNSLNRIEKETYEAKKCVGEEWKKIIQKENGSFKKVVLCELSAGLMVQYHVCILSKLKRILSTFKSNATDIALILRFSPNLEIVCQMLDESMQDDLLSTLENFVSEGWGILDCSDDSSLAIEMSDAYYGDITPELQFMRNRHRVALLENRYL